MEFKQIWQEYGNRLQQFLRSRVKNPADVDDLLQEILLKTYQHLNTIKDSEKLLSWLFEIARNGVCLAEELNSAEQSPTLLVFKTALEGLPSPAISHKSS